MIVRVMTLVMQVAWRWWRWWRPQAVVGAEACAYESAVSTTRAS